jgi:hypothetical protein
MSTENKFVKYTVLVDGEPHITAAGLGLLLGVTEQQVIDHYRASGDRFDDFPPEWHAQSDLIRAEAEAATGSSEVMEHLYWLIRNRLQAEAVDQGPAASQSQQ